MKKLLFVMLMLSSSVYAGIGTITEQEGITSVLRQKASISGLKGTPIEMNDTVSTGSKGKTSITFEDNTKVNVTENSKLLIDDFVYDPKNKGAGKLAIKVALGTVRYASGQVAHDNPNNVKINTPTATIAVRGTDFVMSVDELGRSMVVLMPQCDETGKCIDGAIDVTTAAGTVSMNRPFQATYIETQGNSPPPPVLIKLDPKNIGNNMQIVTPQTLSGGSLVNSAREAVKEATKSLQEKNAEKNNNPSTGVSGVTSEQEAQIVQQSTSTTVTQTNNASPPSIQKSVEELLTPGSHVSPIYQGQTLIGWQYYNVSQSNNELAHIKLPKDTLVQIVVIQDYIMDAYQFANKPGGYITIKQNQAR